jgi:D-arabinose 1-dehydrogenase-like Zn-dependent alcohol dehydrogenase
MTIRAAVLTAPRVPVEVWELPDPVAEPGSVLLETVVSEVCGTDVHLFHGRLAGVPYPIVPGHVSVGRVVARHGVASDALDAPLRDGDLVTFYDVHEVCGACYHCTVARQPNRCPSRRIYGITYSAGDGPLGGWAERIYLKPGVRIVRVPEELSPDVVIGGGCGLFTGFAAVERSDLAMGDVVVVQGAGPVGLAAAAFAALRGASVVAVIGAPQARLELATAGRGADVVIEASGNPAAVREALDLLRDGGVYVIAGHYTDTGTAEINPHVHVNRRHADVRGQWGTDFRHVLRALRLLAKHRDRLRFDRIIGGRYALQQAQEALDDVAELRVTKAVIEPGQG